MHWVADDVAGHVGVESERKGPGDTGVARHARVKLARARKCRFSNGGTDHQSSRSGTTDQLCKRAQEEKKLTVTNLKACNPLINEAS